MSIIDDFDIDLFRARLHYDLRLNRLSSDNWEKAIAEATSSRWIKGSADLADAVNHKHRQCISVKSRMVAPHRKKRIESRDFITHPSHFHFGGKVYSEGDLDNLHTVSRRCSIPGLDEQISPAVDIGQVAIQDYLDFEQRSLDKFDCDDTMDVVVVHGESANGKNYLARVMFFDHVLNPIINWKDVHHGPKSKYSGKRSMIVGEDENGPHLGRIGNLGRQQTCMIRFYRSTEAIETLDLSVPMPRQEKFNFQQELVIMQG